MSTPAWLVGAGPYLSLFHGTEQANGIPQDLLTRIGFQESSWRPEVINCTVKSPAGAVGIMQLLPQFFPGAGASVAADISMAGKYLSELYDRFGDWQSALAAYNWGPGNVHHLLQQGGGLVNMPKETQNYVSDIVEDVPVQGALV